MEGDILPIYPFVLMLVFCSTYTVGVHSGEKPGNGMAYFPGFHKCLLGCCKHLRSVSGARHPKGFFFRSASTGCLLVG